MYHNALSTVYVLGYLTFVDLKVNLEIITTDLMFIIDIWSYVITDTSIWVQFYDSVDQILDMNISPQEEVSSRTNQHVSQRFYPLCNTIPNIFFGLV